MRAEDVSPNIAGTGTAAAVPRIVRPATDPTPVTPRSRSAVRSDLLYELELELRHTAKQLARGGVPSSRVLVAVPVPDPKSGVPNVSWLPTGLSGWMIGPRLCVLEDGTWVPYTVGRTHKLDKPRHSRMFGDASSKEYAQRWQDLTDAGVAPGAGYVSLDAENQHQLGASRDPRRAEVFEVETINGIDHLVMPYDRGSAGAKLSVVRDDLQRWLKMYR